VRTLGVTRMYWTFDPLVSRNAHFNLTRLGAHVVEYVPDMYGGDTNSVLHRGVGTDRFIVAWDIAGAASGAGEDAVHGASSRTDAPILNRVGADGLPAIPNVDGQVPTTVRVAVPEAIEQVQSQSIEDAARWRASTRRAFMWALDHGYRVRAFTRDDAAHYGFYVCTRDNR